jgi:cyclic lactone autoinducer peptide
MVMALLGAGSASSFHSYQPLLPKQLAEEPSKSL